MFAMNYVEGPCLPVNAVNAESRVLPDSEPVGLAETRIFVGIFDARADCRDKGLVHSLAPVGDFPKGSLGDAELCATPTCIGTCGCPQRVTIQSRPAIRPMAPTSSSTTMAVYRISIT